MMKWGANYANIRKRHAASPDIPRCMKLAASKSEQRLLRILEDERHFCNVEIGHLPVNLQTPMGIYVFFWGLGNGGCT